jgi:nucleoside permease NupC
MGVPGRDVPAMADLLGTKLVANEFVSFVKLTT